jgi:PadR family transcriptional regulator PadR
MAKGYLGKFEEMVLLAILGLGDNAYGVSIMNRINEAMPSHYREGVTCGALYTTLHRLHRKKWVTCAKGPPTPRRGGRAKMLFHLTELGQSKIDEAARSRKILSLTSES